MFCLGGELAELRRAIASIYCFQVYPGWIYIYFIRVDDWFLMSSPLPVLGLCLLYVFVVWFAGPAFMKHRQPYDIKLLMITYNLFQVFLWQFYVAKRPLKSYKMCNIFFEHGFDPF